MEGVWTQQSWAPLGSSSSHGFLRGRAKLAKKEKATNKITTNRNTLASIPSKKGQKKTLYGLHFIKPNGPPH